MGQISKNLAAYSVMPLLMTLALVLGVGWLTWTLIAFTWIVISLLIVASLVIIVSLSLGKKIDKKTLERYDPKSKASIASNVIGFISNVITCVLLFMLGAYIAAGTLFAVSMIYRVLIHQFTKK